MGGVKDIESRGDNRRVEETIGGVKETIGGAEERIESMQTIEGAH